MPDSVTTKTTTLVIEKPDSFEKLAQKYCLMRYELPPNYRLQYDEDFSRVHIAIKTHLRVPYRLFTNERATPDDRPRRVIYALFLRGEETVKTELTIDLSTALSGQEIQASQLPFHMLVKLLQMSYAQTDESAFTAIGKYYVHAKGQKSPVTCLEIEIKGDRQNKEGDRKQIFQVISHAKQMRLRRKESIQPRYKYIDPHFRRQIKDGQHLYIQLLPDEIDDFNGEIFTFPIQSKERASLDFHSNLDPERTRGKRLFDFTHKFVKYLSLLDIHAYHAERHFTQFIPSATNAKFQAGKMACVYLYDNRLSKTETAIESYQSLLRQRCPDIDFEIIQELHSGLEHPVLIVQDHTKADFEEGGKYYPQIPDPYKQIRNNPDLVCIPKQSIHIDSFVTDGTPQVEKKLTQIIAVCMTQLCLKQLVLSDQPIHNGVPFSFRNKLGQPTTLSQYAFVRQKNYGNNQRYGVVAWMEGEYLRFEDILAPQGRLVLNDSVVVK